MKRWFLFVICILASCSTPEEQKPITQAVANTDFTFMMVPVQASSGNFWISRTEVVWDLYDIFLQFINSPDNLHAGVDAVTGPTPAYASVDRGFGRTGFPAISMSAQSAEAFCKWLSSRTNRTYTIPTIDQWEAANVGGGGAWHQWNAEKTTHLVATTEPNALGIYDMRGNVGEWVSTVDGPRVIGGSFRTPAKELGSASMLIAEKSWNVTDPQLPRSPWWFADADYVGLRLVTTDGDSHE
jgi:formylglycine-generating enzyme required for sulfatase activity